jgi:hypothetical protein
VITLVYGLGFGMVIVLLVVPAILAMQQDFAPAGPRAAPGGRSSRADAGAAGRIGDGGLSAATALFIAARRSVSSAWIGSVMLAGLRRDRMTPLPLSRGSRPARPPSAFRSP